MKLLHWYLIVAVCFGLTFNAVDIGWELSPEDYQEFHANPRLQDIVAFQKTGIIVD